MIRYLSLLFLLASFFAHGQQKISDMTSATTLSGSEYVPIVQTTNKKATVSLLRGFGSYGTAGQYMTVNGTANGFTFVTPPFISSYPGAGIAVSTGSAWGTSITDNSAVWNTAITTATGTQTFTGDKTLNTGGFYFNVSGVADGGMNGSWYFDDWSLYGYNSGSRFQINQGTSVSDGFFELRTNNYYNGFTAGYDGSKRGFGIYTGTAVANQRLFIHEDGHWLVNGSAGTSGQVLTSAGTGATPTWTTVSGGGGLTVGTSTITSGTNTRILYNNSGVLGEYPLTNFYSTASGGTATGTNTFAMGSNPFILTSGVTTGTGATAGIQNVFNSLTTGNGLDVSTSSLTSGNLVTLASTGTAAASNTQTVLNIATSGANGTSTQTTYGARVSNTHTGTSSTNVGLYATASGGTNNIGVDISVTPASATYGLRTTGRTLLGAGGLNSEIFFGTTSHPYLYTPAANRLEFNASGPSNTNGISTWSFSTYSVSTLASGNQDYFRITSAGFAPTSGTGTQRFLSIGWTINQTGGANGKVIGVSVNPTHTATADFVAFDYSPSGTPTTDLSFRATQGNMLVPASSYHNWGTTVGSTGYGVRGNSGVIEVKNSGGDWVPIQPTAINTKTETVAYNAGTMGSASVSTQSIHAESYYSNSTTLLAKITVVAIKTDGSASAHSTVTARFRKNSSGTWSVDDAGTDITSDITILADVVGDFTTNPNVKVTMGAASGNYNVSWVAETIEVK